MHESVTRRANERPAEGPPPTAAESDALARIALLTALIDRGEPCVPADAAAWRRVRRGLSCLLLAVWVLVAAGATAALSTAWAPLHTPVLDFGCRISPGEAALYAEAAVFVGCLLAGHAWCSTAPRRRGARRFGVLCLACFVGALAVLSAGLFLPPLFHDPVKKDIRTTLGVLAFLLTIGHLLSFCFFLRGVAAALDAGHPLRHLTELTAAVAVMECLIAALLAAGLLEPRAVPAILFGAGCLLAPFAFGVLGWFVFSVLKARAAVAAYLSGEHGGRI
jgi:hypothetical protein